ncbi:hypothetical protein [Piscinibacterium candidicorallinum]|uniref:Uncharacterized protein n=1 Tax=Piscinibacterium candidicorallinum TaxID=1793872 RepID=A0ABV7H7N9_9BURK
MEEPKLFKSPPPLVTGRTGKESALFAVLLLFPLWGTFASIWLASTVPIITPLVAILWIVGMVTSVVPFFRSPGVSTGRAIVATITWWVLSIPFVYVIASASASYFAGP